MGCRRTFLLTSAISAVAIGALSVPARADVLVTFEALALTEELAPGTGGRFYRGFNAPAINGAGQVAFVGLHGTSGQPQATSTPAIWSDSPGTLTLAASVGSPAPGTSDNFMTNFGGARVGIGGSGNLIFVGVLDSGDSATDRGVWHGPAGAVSLFAREGDDVPDALFTDPPFDGSQPEFNGDLGQAGVGPSGIGMFNSPMTHDTGNISTEQSRFINTGAGLQALMIAGTQVPGEAANTLYSGTITVPRVNSLGQTTFASVLKGSAEPTNPTAIFFGPAGDVRVVAAGGRQAPSMAAGVNYDSVHSPDLNESGEMVFVAGLSSFGNATPSVGDAVFFGTLGNILPAAKVGDLVGTDPALTYAQFGTFIGATVNDSSQIAFQALVAGTGVTIGNDLVIMGGQAGDPADLVIVAREGTGTVPADIQLLDGPIISNGGFLAFTILENGPGNQSLWMADLNGNLGQIVRTGDNAGDLGLPGVDPALDVLALRTGTTNEGYRFLSDDATVVFGIVFNDGSEGVFTASVAIPEPAGVLVVLGAAGLLLRRRRV